ncbi:MAG: hypothetical protein N2450_02665 [bacterium]|nr:hypothetical protein [bacterium]
MKKSFLDQLSPLKEGGFVFSIRIWLIILFYFFVFFLLAWNIPNPITGIDSGLKWLGAQQFANHNTITLPDIQHPNFPPCPAPFVELINRKLYPVFPPLPMIINGILFKYFTDRFWWLLPLGSTFLLVILLVKKYSMKGTSVHFFIVTLLFSTPIAVYSISFWEHTTALLLLVIGFLAIESHKKLFKIAAVLSLVLASAFRPESILFSLGLFFYLIKKRKPLSTHLLVIFLILHFVYFLLHKIIIGTWLPLQIISNYHSNQSTIALLLQKKNPIQSWWRLLFGAGNGRIEIVSILCVVLFYWGYLKKNKLVYSLCLIPLLYLYTRIFNEQPIYSIIRGNGLLLTMPIVVLFFFLQNQFPELKKWFYASIFLIIGTLFMGQTVEGIHWSARLLLPLAIPSTIILNQLINVDKFWKQFGKAIVWTSTLVTIYGIYWTVHISFQQKKCIQSIPLTGEPILSSIPWLGGDLAPLQFSQPIVFLFHREQAGNWLFETKLKSETSFRFITHPQNPPIFVSEKIWRQLVVQDTVYQIPMPEKGYSYHYYQFSLTQDTVAFAKLAGELAALKFARNSEEGILLATTALQWNPNDLRPAMALIAFGIARKNVQVIENAIKFIPDSLRDEKVDRLIKEAKDFLKRHQEK